MNLGGCLCGSVRYRITGALAAPIACHCSQCGRTSGNFAVMARCKAEDLQIAPTQHLTWYQSSPTVQRGFCSKCGGNLFWKDAGPDIYVTAGTLDQPTGLKVCEHIFAASKSDFYDITDGLPQKPEW